MQAIGLSFLLLIPILTVQGPPKFTWLTHEVFSPPRGPVPPPPHQGPRHPISGTEIHGNQIVAPVSFREHAMQIVDAPSAPSLDDFVPGGTERREQGIPGGMKDGVDVAPPRPAPAPVPTHPVRISYWAEGGLVYRVQPVYPPLARQARIQGPVELRAIISKAGTIEGLTLVSGHAMLSGAALAAVRQWRYRPYLLNGEPIEVETEITVNFTLTGN
jgi:protein TonB